MRKIRRKPPKWNYHVNIFFSKTLKPHGKKRRSMKELSSGGAYSYFLKIHISIIRLSKNTGINLRGLHIKKASIKNCSTKTNITKKFPNSHRLMGMGQQWGGGNGGGCLQPLRTALHTVIVSLQNNFYEQHTWRLGS